jgi:hypothetical protein
MRHYPSLIALLFIVTDACAYTVDYGADTKNRNKTELRHVWLKSILVLNQNYQA